MITGLVLLTEVFVTDVTTDAQIRHLGTERGAVESFDIEVMAEALSVPAGFAFLPDGRLLVAERRAARFTLVDPGNGKHTALEGQPPVHTASGDGGAHEIVLHPDFRRNGWIYASYTAQDTVALGTNLVLAVDRFRLNGARILDRERLFTSRPAVAAPGHFGGRLVVAGGFLFITSGDRAPDQTGRDEAQSLMSHAGKVLRLHDDGRIPADNPFRTGKDVLPEIWSLGHRNPQGLAIHPVTRDLWLHEHGPMGGDEINIVREGRNYGWPVTTFGREYTGPLIGRGLFVRDGIESPLHYWVPSIAPSGMAFYEGASFASWRGSLFVGAIGARAGRHLARLVFDDAGRLRLEERLLLHRGWSVRDVRVAPDGAVWLAVDDGMILRLRPSTH